MSNPIILRPGSHIGQPDAEADAEYLFDCFIDTEGYERAVDTNDAGSILLGRTGSGKSAIIRKIFEQQENSIELSPEVLSLSYIANSQTIAFFEAAGVHLDAFYVLLWKHILTVELLRKKYHINNEHDQESFLSMLMSGFKKNKSKERALDYLRQWGEQFWIDTDYRVKEFTTTLEGKLEAGAGVEVALMRAGASAATRLSEEQKVEIINRGQQIVNDVQIKDLHEVLKLLADDIFSDYLEKYYVCIDRLDEDWVSDKIRFKLLKALVETIRTFRQVRPVKIIVSMRTDLYFTMLTRTTSPGFQEEKFAGYYIRMKWDRESIYKLLDRRVSYLFKYKYTRENVHLKDILPTNQMEKGSASDYIIDRTFFRPREAISFLNKCLEKGAGKSRLNANMIRDAEIAYSNERLTSIFDEWRREYPYLRELVHFIRGSRVSRRLSDIPDADIEKFCLDFAQDANLQAPEHRTLRELAENAALGEDGQPKAFLRQMLSLLYQTGIVGLKIMPNSPRIWSFEDHPTIEPAEISEDTVFFIHKAFHRSLAITYDRT